MGRSWRCKFLRCRVQFQAAFCFMKDNDIIDFTLQDLLEKHTSLLSSLSDIDATSNVSSFNSRLCHSPDLLRDEPDSPQCHLFNEALGNKAQSIENLMMDSESLHSDEYENIDSLPKTEVTKCGQSSFYSLAREDSMCGKFSVPFFIKMSHTRGM